MNNPQWYLWPHLLLLSPVHSLSSHVPVSGTSHLLFSLSEVLTLLQPQLSTWLISSPPSGIYSNIIFSVATPSKVETFPQHSITSILCYFVLGTYHHLAYCISYYFLFPIKLKFYEGRNFFFFFFVHHYISSLQLPGILSIVKKYVLTEWRNGEIVPWFLVVRSTQILLGGWKVIVPPEMIQIFSNL